MAARGAAIWGPSTGFPPIKSLAGSFFPGLNGITFNRAASGAATAPTIAGSFADHATGRSAASTRGTGGLNGSLGWQRAAQKSAYSAMTDKVDGWMPLHIGRYMAATGHLSTEEHGMYLLLLMHAWTNGGAIPGDPERVRRICRADPESWARSSATILDFLTPQGDGTYRQKRLDAELAKATEAKEVKAEAGKKGAAARWQTHTGANGKSISTANAPALPSQCPIPIPEPKQSQEPPSPDSNNNAPPQAQPMGAVDDSKAHELGAICSINRVEGGWYNSEYVRQWVRDGVSGEQLREAIAIARSTGKPDPQVIPVRYMLPIVARVVSGGGKPVDNSWRRDEKRAVAKGREVGVNPRIGEDMGAFVRRVDEALSQRARSQVQ
jgi:uncharacterized protein YdaU (DUF1376 family)